MHRIKIYQVDAFTSRLFSGNPAAVCPLDQWLHSDLLQQIAMENNLAETAFYVPKQDHYEIRWFTPTVEVDLCGHATLAAAYVLLHHEGHQADTIRFHSPRSGALSVQSRDEWLTLDFPEDTLQEAPKDKRYAACFDVPPTTVLLGNTDFLFVYENAQQIRSLIPNLNAIKTLGNRGVIVTAPGDKVDFVSRFFAPQSGIDEDPVTGSAHTSLTPYWASQLKKNPLTAMQLSRRQGVLNCELKDGRVQISGQAKLYLEGHILVPTNG